MGLQGWKKECFLAYMKLWEIESYIHTTISKVDTARDIVDTIREKQRNIVQNQIKKILAAFGLIEALGVITELTEYAHSRAYQSSLRWGILHFLAHVRPDFILSISSLLLFLLFVVAMIYTGNTKD